MKEKSYIQEIKEKLLCIKGNISRQLPIYSEWKRKIFYPRMEAIMLLEDLCKRRKEIESGGVNYFIPNKNLRNLKGCKKTDKRRLCGSMKILHDKIVSIKSLKTKLVKVSDEGLSMLIFEAD